MLYPMCELRDTPGRHAIYLLVLAIEGNGRKAYKAVDITITSLYSTRYLLLSVYVRSSRHT
jgi:hypothetical protein